MGIKTAIEYADSSANPTPFCYGCELFHTDPSRNHCYAATLVNRYKGLRGWPADFRTPKYFRERMDVALGWPDLTGKDRPEKPWMNGYPRIVFVNDLGDGFSPIADPGVWLLPYLDRMAESPHIWLMLTKWPDRMREFFDLWGKLYDRVVPSNFILGVSITKRRYEWRMGPLLSIQGDHKRMISFSPLLENVTPLVDPMPNVDFVVIEGESGGNARFVYPDAFRSIIKQCERTNTPVMFKQWGEWKPAEFDQEWNVHRWSGSRNVCCMVLREKDVVADNIRFYKIGKKHSGRTLDGKEYLGMPRWENAS